MTTRKMANWFTGLILKLETAGLQFYKHHPGAFVEVLFIGIPLLLVCLLLLLGYGVIFPAASVIAWIQQALNAILI